MCLAIIGKVLETDEKNAVIEYHGSRIKASAGLMKVEKGEYVLVHAGCIIQKVTEDDAAATEEIMNEIFAG